MLLHGGTSTRGQPEVLSGRLSAPGAPATDEKRRGAAFPGGRARGVFPRRLIGGSDRSLWLLAGRYCLRPRRARWRRDPVEARVYDHLAVGVLCVAVQEKHDAGP